MKKIISYVTIFTILFLNLSIFTFETVKADIPIFSGENYFVVTAYYSPLPDQKYYFKGSYEEDIKLNGKGERGASGKNVFAGMFAAPKSYEFGTKIFLEGIGIGEVADRGGAIVSTDPSESRGYEYDRIDIWMGYGEEGLAKALTWGKKTLKGYVIADREVNTTIDLNNFSIAENVFDKLSKNTVDVETQKITTIKKVIETKVSSHIESIGSPKVGDIGENVRILQKTLIVMGYLKVKDSAIFGNTTKKSLIKYQIDRGIVLGFDDEGAGYFGPKTKKNLKKDLAILLEKHILKEKKLLSYKK